MKPAFRPPQMHTVHAITKKSPRPTDDHMVILRKNPPTREHIARVENLRGAYLLALLKCALFGLTVPILAHIAINLFDLSLSLHLLLYFKLMIVSTLLFPFVYLALVGIWVTLQTFMQKPQENPIKTTEKNWEPTTTSDPNPCHCSNDPFSARKNGDGPGCNCRTLPLQIQVKVHFE